ncbi:TolB protein [Bacillus niacini]|uniref:TolB protein n=1 Tax=Neobacillus niacini TaxID=86668 RepID=A0A852T6H9_9BACI|nr:LysM peptidoglycan-binding domain-containing protein [Neobacillus niacini]NYE04253.1 TolB protein [Neobacillus niacini]
MQLFYTVRPGDTLYQIARRWELPLETLIAANNLTSPNSIFVGQQLSVPPGVDVIRVKPGDTVNQISQNFGVPASVIIQANELQPPYVIQAGQLLKVPPGFPYYVVQPGDTLFQIANRFNVITGSQSNFELIMKVNNLSSTVISPGMKLIIPYAPPGDRGVIAYTSNRSGSYDIWIYNPSNGVNQQITNGLAESYSIPYWSPDSTKIAFVGKNGILHILNLVDNSIAQIDQFADGLVVFLDWSPNSQEIVYTKPNGLVIYNVITHSARILNAPGATDAQWFPSGTDLLFQQANTKGVSQLFRIKTNGTGKVQITRNTGGRLNNVRLSPDGTYALYTTPGASISIIYSVNLSTGNVIEVKGGPLAKNYYPTWSPDSHSFAFSATAFENLGYFSQIRTAGRQGMNEVTRAISNCFATPVSWSPDSRKIAYLSGCKQQGSSSEIWLVDLTHPVPIQLVEGGSITALEWSPLPVTSLKKTYSNSVYKVRFHYPSHWQRVNDERYEGEDGFFQISAIASDQSIEVVCQNEAFHQLNPYGTKPRIQHTRIGSQPACLIFPSQDQPVEMNNQAALIVRYPNPVVIEGTEYQYFILWADQNHIIEMSTSLTFQ